MSEQQAQSSRRRRRSRLTATAGLCVVAASVMGVGFVADAFGGSAASSSMTKTDGEVFTGITPIRLLDTRSGVGAPAPGAFGPNETRSVVAAGVGGVPASATGIAMNVTLPRSASSSSFVTVWASGTPQPPTSTSNATPGQAVPNSATSSLGSNGGINVFNERGNTHIVIDIVGYYVSTDSVDLPGGVVYNGTGAPSNSIGMDGDFYIDVVRTDMYLKEAAKWGTPIVELGGSAPGAASNEPHVIAANGAPSSSDGTEGDVYLDTAALAVYGPKVGSAWGAARSLVGGAPTAATDSAVGAATNASALVNAGLGADKLAIALPRDVVTVGSALTFTNNHTITVNTKGTYKVSYSVDAVNLALLGAAHLQVGPNTVESHVLAAANGSVDQVRLIQANANDTIRLQTTGLLSTLGTDISASIVVELVAVG